MSSINDRITQAVTNSGLTKTAFGKRIGISQSMVSMLCSGAAKPSDRTIADICREFRIREEWLRDGVEPMKLPEPDADMEVINRLMEDADDEVARFVKKFMKVYYELNPENQAVINSFIRSLRDQK